MDRKASNTPTDDGVACDVGEILDCFTAIQMISSGTQSEQRPLIGMPYPELLTEYPT
jgi:hypothetical protein